jgi:hypothetical protein
MTQSGRKAARGTKRLRLLRLAHARSGDKGDMANIGLIALRPEYYPVLEREVTAARVARHFRGIIKGKVERYELPNLNALNFLLAQDGRPGQGLLNRPVADGDCGTTRSRCRLTG